MGQGQAKGKALTKDEMRRVKRFVSFSEEEITEWYSDFDRRSLKLGDDRHSKFINEEEFVKVYKSVYTTGDSEKFAKHVFRTFDLKKDGRLDFLEFLIGMSVSGSSNPEKLTSWAFRLYDVDNTGYIDMPEMIEIIQSVYRLLGPVKLRLDGVDWTAESLAESIFTQLDRDRDQKISWREFNDGASLHPLVIRLLQCNPLEEFEDDVFST